MKVENHHILVLYYFIAWLGGSMAWFVQPFYFTHLGYTYEDLGVIFSLLSASQAVMFLFSGPLTLKLGYKRTIYLAVVFFMVTRVIHVIAPTYPLLLLASLSFGIGVALETPAFMTLLSEAVPEGGRHSLFSVNWGMATIGGALGILLGGYLSQWIGYRGALIVAAFFIPLQGIIMLFVHEDGPAKKNRLALTVRMLRRVLLLVTPIALIGFAGGIVLPYMGLWFNESYGMSITDVGMVFTLLQFVMGFGSFLAPLIVSRTGDEALIISFTAISGLTIAGMPFVESFMVATALYITRMLLVNTEVPIWDSYYVSHFSEKERATALALKGFGWTAAFSGGQLLGGILFQDSLSLPLIVSGFIHIASALAFWITKAR